MQDAETRESRETERNVSLGVDSEGESKVYTLTGFVIQLRALDFGLRVMQSPQGNYSIRCASWTDQAGCGVKN